MRFLAILSPDTSIFITAFIGSQKSEQLQCTVLIETDLKRSQSVLVDSVKREFYDIIDKFHTAIETMILHLNSSKTMDQAITLLPQIPLIDKNEIKNRLEIIGLSIKDIEKDLRKREEFSSKINSKLAEIKSDFAYYARNYFMRDRVSPEQAKQCLEDIKEGCSQINQKHGEIVHWPDKEHWARTALANKTRETNFVTKDHFGFKNDRKKLAEIAGDIEQAINNRLGANFSFLFK